MKRNKRDVNLEYENARKLYEEMEKERTLSIYKFPDAPSSDGFYHVYVEDTSKDSGRRQIKAKNLENLKEKVYQHEKGIDGIARKTFKDAFQIVQKERIKYIKDPVKKLSVQNSITCIEYDYKRYFDGTDFEKMYVDNISKRDIESVCMHNLQRYDLSMKAFLSLRGIIKSVMSLAYEQYWIFDNPYTRINFKKYQHMVVRPLPSEERVHSEEEIELILKRVHEHQKKYPSRIPAYALELQLLMGLRRGEVPPLEWADVSSSFISITKEQLLVRKGPGNPKGYCIIVNHTKTYMNRKFPITKDIDDLLTRLKKVHFDYYPGSKYLFPSKTTENGVISNTAVYRMYSRFCNDLGIEISFNAKKGPHSFRRNGITKVANSPKGNILMASILYGNSVETASKHYYTGVNLQLAKELLEEGNQR